MTAELLARDQRVTAIDRAPLDARLNGKPGLRFVHADVGDFVPGEGVALMRCCPISMEPRKSRLPT
jgi:hypothetical protein